jgi:hypothetical protein
MYITATAMHGCIRAVAALAVAGLVGSACVRGEGDSATPLPRELHGLELGDLHTGDDAARLIGRLHGSNVSPSESYVGYYGPPEMRAILYLSRFHDHSGAQSQLVAMADRIGSGSGGFGHHTQFHVLGIEIHSVFGYGQIHYFFARESDVVWLGMPPPMARAGLADLLLVAVDSIPSLGGTGRIVT